ncbi:hypothetical protein [Leptospira kirschneri]|uniref:hypothetical protein n=1 Tax=Leptospira kirschneri TaxID=29507 RepID=UPI00356B1047
MNCRLEAKFSRIYCVILGNFANCILNFEYRFVPKKFNDFLGFELRAGLKTGCTFES